MKKIKILVVIDALDALSTSSIKNNVYIVDSNQWLGSWQEGSCQLHTVAEDGQFISWRATGISAASQVNIIAFSGDMVTQSICTPQQSGEGIWEGRVEVRGGSGRYPYKISVDVEGRSFSFSPYLDVQ
ncbi:MAG: hypothetical protein PUP46_06305 [Endozoicomonas sp. (ex Botrylloides leachii)]|nr:hypothetical protein [Endozoicomonas sp. (ex Botrylloides leachii)]